MTRNALHIPNPRFGGIYIDTVKPAIYTKDDQQNGSLYLNNEYVGYDSTLREFESELDQLALTATEEQLQSGEYLDLKSSPRGISAPIRKRLEMGTALVKSYIKDVLDTGKWPTGMSFLAPQAPKTVLSWQLYNYPERQQQVNVFHNTLFEETTLQALLGLMKQAPTVTVTQTPWSKTDNEKSWYKHNLAWEAQQ